MPTACSESRPAPFLKEFGYTFSENATVVELPDIADGPLYRVTDGDRTADIDLKGRLMRLYDTAVLLQDDTGEPLPESEIKALIARVETQCGLEDYRRSRNDDVGANNRVVAYEVTWEKEYSGGLCDSYDSVSLTVSCFDGRIASFRDGRGRFRPNATEPQLSIDRAQELAQPFAEQSGGETLETGEVTLALVRPNFLFEEGGPFEQADFIRLAWQVTVVRTANNRPVREVFVDACTGEVLGGQVYR